MVEFEPLQLTINKQTQTAVFEKGIRLLDAIRRLGYSGTKEGCGEGECGACTILLDGRPVNACLIYAKQAVGKTINTVEAVGDGWADGYHPFQRAMVKVGGVQCGFCTPGIIVAGCHYVDHRGAADDQSIQAALSGNLCRCTGYAKIIEAVKLALKTD